MKRAINRRRFRRVALTIRVVCEARDAASCAISQNISQGGMLLRTVLFRPGEEIRLSFTLPHSKAIYRTIGRVVWVDERGFAGIQFAGMKGAIAGPVAA